MKKTTILILLLYFILFSVNAQLLRIDNQIIAFRGDVIEIPVWISNASNISSFQGSFSHSSDLIFLEAISNEFPISTNVIDNEKVVYIGGDFLNPKTYTTETVFITLKFRVEASANIGFSDIEIVNDPVPTEFFDDSFNAINFTYQNGGLHIQGLLSSTNKIDFNVELENNQLIIFGYLSSQMQSNSFIELATQTGIFQKQIPIVLKDSSYFEIKINYEKQFKYVRIKHQEYISEVKIIPNFEIEDIFSVYPNPANEVLFYNFFTPEQQNSSLYLYDSNGSIVFSQNSNLQNGVISLINLPKGVYFLRYIVKDSVFSKKIIKL